MRLRIPRPSHGWRAFGWEIGVVAIGVALAIGAERLVQQYNWNQDARQASEAIEAELTEHQLDAIERLAVQPCLKRQLSALYEALIVHSGGKWTGMPMQVRQEGTQTAQKRVVTAAYRAPERLWLREAWETARSSGALSHMPDSAVAKYAQAYHRGRQILELQAEENAAAARLSPLAVDGAIDPHSRAQLLGALAETDHANAYIEFATAQDLRLLRELLKDQSRDAVDQAVDDRIASQRRFRGSCVLPLKLMRN